ncbi:hypothetical protein [Aliiglaciecola sp. LCG003]|uniref:hypothetical protein n=1 Tax=Aliiglaciecola sp. LCG003 TaxID=3053655 RepID=UPI0025735E22|nr:hypothetical protein [Aliiglaciecola sp. LCG003]WJG08495.1 hypothetical protein QR722_14260 [Aliiglaciecola sp. LCG003]
MPSFNQRGAVTLLSVTLLLMLTSVIGIYNMKVSHSKHIITLNSQIKSTAMAAAQSGLAEVMNILQADPQWSDSQLRGDIPSVGSYRALISHQRSERLANSLAVHQVHVSANTSEQMGVLQSHQSIISYPLLSTLPHAPLMVNGQLLLTASVTLVANPNGSGTGLPLSIWSKLGLGPLSDAFVSCGHFEYEQASCDAMPYSNNSALAADIVAHDLNFPSDSLAYLSNVPKQYSMQFKDESDSIRNNCSDLPQGNLTMLWIEGDCVLYQGQQLGTALNPVFLVVENGQLELAQQAQINGLVLLLVTDSRTDSNIINLEGLGTIVGAILSDRDMHITGESLVLVFDANILTKLTDSPALRRVANIAGSNRDFQ